MIKYSCQCICTDTQHDSTHLKRSHDWRSGLVNGKNNSVTKNRNDEDSSRCKIVLNTNAPFECSIQSWVRGTVISGEQKRFFYSSFYIRMRCNMQWECSHKHMSVGDANAFPLLIVNCAIVNHMHGNNWMSWSCSRISTFIFRSVHRTHIWPMFMSNSTHKATAVDEAMEYCSPDANKLYEN